MEERKFYVYEWYIINTGEVFYVGKGTGNRYKSLNSRNYFFQCMYNSHDCDVRKIYKVLKENPHIKPIICIEDKTIYKSMTDLSKKLNIIITKITYAINTYNKFVYKNKTYILLENY